MSAHLSTYRERAANPLDVMEQIVAANDWTFDRRSTALDRPFRDGSG